MLCKSKKEILCTFFSMSILMPVLGFSNISVAQENKFRYPYPYSSGSQLSNLISNAKSVSDRNGDNVSESDAGVELDDIKNSMADQDAIVIYDYSIHDHNVDRSLLSDEVGEVCSAFSYTPKSYYQASIGTGWSCSVAYDGVVRKLGHLNMAGGSSLITINRNDSYVISFDTKMSLNLDKYKSFVIYFFNDVRILFDDLYIDLDSQTVINDKTVEPRVEVDSEHTPTTEERVALPHGIRRHANVGMGQGNVGGPDLNNSGWHNIIFEKNGDFWSFYLDGQKRAEGKINPSPENYPTSLSMSSSVHNGEMETRNMYVAVKKSGGDQ